MDGWVDGAQTLQSRPCALLEAPLTESVLTGSAANEGGATARLAVAALVAKDTRWICVPMCLPPSQLPPRSLNPTPLLITRSPPPLSFAFTLFHSCLLFFLLFLNVSLR